MKKYEIHEMPEYRVDLKTATDNICKAFDTLYNKEDKNELDSLFDRLKEIDKEKQEIYDRIEEMMGEKENERW